MFGGAGNDDYYVDDVNDVISETTVPGVDDGGNDRVYSTVSYTLPAFLERLVLLESAVAISATGNVQVNSIVGNSNANIINGGGGKDTLTGGVGADTFVLGPANAANTVTITDFAAEDRFGITASDYGLSQGNGLVDNGAGRLVLDPAWFATVTGTQGTVAGHGQFLYNATTRSVMWDADGSGAAAGIALAKLQTGAVVTADNFAISGATSNPVVGDISINDVTIAEGNSGTAVATFTVTRSGGTAAFDVNFATADGTATGGSDYVAQPTSTLSFAAGDLTKTVSVTINGDTTVEPNETFFVNLSNATNGGTITRSQGTGTIANDDAAAVRRQHLDQRRHDHRGQCRDLDRHLHGHAERRDRGLRRQLCHGGRHGNGRQRLCRAADQHAELRRRRSHQDRFGDHQRRHDGRTQRDLFRQSVERDQWRHHHQEPGHRHHQQRRQRRGRRQHLDQRRHDRRGQCRDLDCHLHGHPERRNRSLRRQLCHGRWHGNGAAATMSRSRPAR